MTIRPISDNVIIKVNREENNQTSSGIILLKSKNGQERFQNGEVVAVGPGRYNANGELIPVSVSVGENIIFNKFAGIELETPDEELYLLIREADILAVQEQ